MDRFLKNPEAEIENIVEILNNTLYFAILRGINSNRRLKCDGDLFYFTTDEEFIYQNYYCDFGPLNISCLYKYCLKLNKYIQYARGIKGIVHYTCSHPDKKANAAFLMGSYCVIYLKMQPREVAKLFHNLGPFKPFLDASQFSCQFTLKLVDCFQAVAKAQAFNFFNFEDFNASEYDLYNKLEYGDMNWLLPRKFLAFIGPADNRTAHPPEFYIKYFLKNDVKTVIRLNNVLYDSYAFMQVGIQHYDLIFPDGTTPPKNILLKFLYIAETAPAAIAVHCKAGLGRTGSLIGAYLIKHYRMTAREAIAWMRICRPGSVIGQQQIWLEKIQSWLWRIGSQYRLQHYGEGDKIPRHKYGVYSKLWPIEREKVIREARKNIQTKFTKSQIDNFMQEIFTMAGKVARNRNHRKVTADSFAIANCLINLVNVSTFRVISLCAALLLHSYHKFGSGLEESGFTWLFRVFFEESNNSSYAHTVAFPSTVGDFYMYLFWDTTQRRRKLTSVDRLLGTDSKFFPSSGDSFRNISKLLCSVHGLCQSDTKEQLLPSESRIKKHSRSEKCINCTTMEVSPKKLIKKASKKTLQRDMHKNVITAKPTLKPSIITQGDKLNEIKMNRILKNRIQGIVKCRDV